MEVEKEDVGVAQRSFVLCLARQCSQWARSCLYVIDSLPVQFFRMLAFSDSSTARGVREVFLTVT